MKFTQREILSYQGRRICEAKDLGGGYCGSVSLEQHASQVRDPESWVNDRHISHWITSYEENIKEKVYDKKRHAFATFRDGTIVFLGTISPNDAKEEKEELDKILKTKMAVENRIEVRSITTYLAKTRETFRYD